MLYIIKGENFVRYFEKKNAVEMNFPNSYNCSIYLQQNMFHFSSATVCFVTNENFEK